MTISAAEQYLMELLNRARLDPTAEAARQGIALNQGLPSGSYGTISAAPKQVLAPDSSLDKAAESHGNWMASTGNFSHTGAGGSDHTTRIRAAGYAFDGAWHLGENLARGPSGTATESLMRLHQHTLFNSPLHRSNMFDSSYREFGAAATTGSGASYLTEEFGYQSGRRYVTGVAYTDKDADIFYSMGEGRAGVKFSVTGSYSDTTETAGGYGMRVKSGTAVEVKMSTSVEIGRVLLDTTNGNVKLDLVNNEKIYVSGDATLVSGINVARLLGAGNLSLDGNSSANGLYGNRGSNAMEGHGGNDKIYARAGNDAIKGGTGNDYIRGEEGSDKIYGESGSDTISGGSSNDTIAGGSGTDYLYGSTGADRFQFKSGYDTDKIMDYSRSSGDRLQFDNALWSGTLSDTQVVAKFAEVISGDVIFDFGGGDRVILDGVTSTSGLSSLIDQF